MKALVVINSLAGGGAERVVTRVLGALADRAVGDAYRLALLENRCDYAVPPGVAVEALGPARGSRLGKLAGLVGTFLRLIRLVRRERPDVIMAFLPRSGTVALLGRLLVPGWPRVVVSERVAIGSNYRSCTGRLARLAIRWLYPLADRVVAVSPGVAAELASIGVPPLRVAVVPNPIAIPELVRLAEASDPHPRASAGRPLLVAVGRLEAQKGYPVLLEALARLRRDVPAHLIVFGEGPERRRLETETARLGLGDAVAWVGFDPNPFPTVAAADVFVLPSLWEGFPNALLEAMALGRPAVAADCPYGPRELLGETGGGLLVPPGDTVALAAGLRRLLADDTLRARLGEAARRRAADYDVRTIAARYREILAANDRTTEG